MCFDRFMCYLTGKGLEQFNIKADPNRRCNDMTPPRDNVEVNIPYKLYFAKNSRTWGGAVAFLDKDIKASEKSPTIGRAYLISKEQFEHVWSFEGKGWYGHILRLDDINGIKAVTMTGERRYEQTNPVPKAYIDVIAKGLMELGYSEDFAYAYVAAKKMNYVDID